MKRRYISERNYGGNTTAVVRIVVAVLEARMKLREKGDK